MVVCPKGHKSGERRLVSHRQGARDHWPRAIAPPPCCSRGDGASAESDRSGQSSQHRNSLLYDAKRTLAVNEGTKMPRAALVLAIGVVLGAAVAIYLVA